MRAPSRPKRLERDPIEARAAANTRTIERRGLEIEFLDRDGVIAHPADRKLENVRGEAVIFRVEKLFESLKFVRAANERDGGKDFLFAVYHAAAIA